MARPRITLALVCEEAGQLGQAIDYYQMSREIEHLWREFR